MAKSTALEKEVLQRRKTGQNIHFPAGQGQQLLPEMAQNCGLAGRRIGDGEFALLGEWRWTRHTNDFFSKSRSKHSENLQLTERFHSLSSVLVREKSGLKAAERGCPKSLRILRAGVMIFSPYRAFQKFNRVDDNIT